MEVYNADSWVGIVADIGCARSLKRLEQPTLMLKERRHFDIERGECEITRLNRSVVLRAAFDMNLLVGVIGESDSIYIVISPKPYGSVSQFCYISLRNRVDF